MHAPTGRSDGGTGTPARRVLALVRRYWFLYRSSWPRLLEVVYWPTLQMVMWGFLQTFLARQSGFFAQAGGILLGAVMLWDILFRGQLGFSMSFLEEMWSRNLGHLLVSPLRPREFISALMVMSLFRIVIGLFPATVLAIAFFGFNVYAMGLALVAFFVTLVLTSWAIALFVCGVMLRHGLGAQGLVWSLIFLLLPLCCVYYPASVLPEWLQTVSFALPPTYAFEGMRTLLIDKVFRPELMWTALALNALYFAAGLAAFYWFYNDARRRGVLLQIGE